MDVLNEVKKAEAEAERIEASYMEKISQFKLDSNNNLEKKRQDTIYKIEEEFKRNGKSLDAEIEKERITIQKEAENSLLILKKEAESKLNKAVTVLIDRLVNR